MAALDPGKLNTFVEIQGRATTQDAVYRTSVESWSTIASVWAEVQDMLPSRGERVAEGINIARRPARVRMYYRDDVHSGMRMKIGSRLLKIVAGPAELGFREGIELLAEEQTTEGQDA